MFGACRCPPNRVRSFARACYIGYMRNRLRSFFLCLLIVSLPMQSFAGVASVACGMAHQHLSAYVAEPDIALMVATPLSEAQGSVRSHIRLEASDASSPDDDCEHSGSHARSGCRTCASCCIGAYAPPPATVVTAVEEAVEALQQFPPSPFTGHIPARIERPPRARMPIAT